MNKKDRIALVVSALYGLLPISAIMAWEPGGFIATSIPLVIYWGYRFIKNDISFLNKGGMPQ